MMPNLLTRFLAACKTHAPDVDPVDILDAIVYPNEYTHARTVPVARAAERVYTSLPDVDQRTLEDFTDSSRDDLVADLDAHVYVARVCDLDAALGNDAHADVIVGLHAYVMDAIVFAELDQDLWLPRCKVDVR